MIDNWDAVNEFNAVVDVLTEEVNKFNAAILPVCASIISNLLSTDVLNAVTLPIPVITLALNVFGINTFPFRVCVSSAASPKILEPLENITEELSITTFNLYALIVLIFHNSLSG